MKRGREEDPRDLLEQLGDVLDTPVERRDSLAVQRWASEVRTRVDAVLRAMRARDEENGEFFDDRDYEDQLATDVVDEGLDAARLVGALLEVGRPQFAADVLRTYVVHLSSRADMFGDLDVDLSPDAWALFRIAGVNDWRMQFADEEHVNLFTKDVLLDSVPVVKRPVFEPGDDEKVCAICLSDITEDCLDCTRTKCGHDFHLSCLEMWLKEKRTCPSCRTPLPRTVYHVPAFNLTDLRNLSVPEILQRVRDRVEDVERDWDRKGLFKDGDRSHSRGRTRRRARETFRVT